MKGTTHALTCIDSLPTAIRREIYIFPVTEFVVKQAFYAIIVFHTTVNSQNLHVILVSISLCMFI